MSKMLTHSALGKSSDARKNDIYERVSRSAENFASRGINTRIPFLKQAFCGQDVPSKPEVRLANSYTEGDIASFSFSQVLFTKNLYDDLIRFNIANVKNGLQFVSVKPGKGEKRRYKVLPCATWLKGDLRLSYFQANEYNEINSDLSFYNRNLFQVYFREKNSEDIGPAIVAHEIEHARHFSLSEMCQYFSATLSKTNVEYMAMLAEFLETGVPSIAMVGRGFLEVEKIERPHLRAGIRFVNKFMAQHELQTFQVDLAICAALGGSDTGEESFRTLQKMKDFAKAEYEESYAKMFGIGLSDIRELIYRLPTR